MGQLGISELEGQPCNAKALYNARSPSAADGQRRVFSSRGNNLGANDTNGSGSDGFLYDHATNARALLVAAGTHTFKPGETTKTLAVRMISNKVDEVDAARGCG